MPAWLGARVLLDTTAPVATGTINEGAKSPEGWYGIAPLTVGPQRSDATSGVASCPQPGTITTEGAGQSFTSGPVGDRAGNTVTVSVDLTDPTPTIGATNGTIALRAPQRATSSSRADGATFGRV